VRSLSRLLGAAARAYLRSQEQVRAAHAVSQAVGTGLFAALLDDDEKRALTSAVYQRAAAGSGALRVLPPWEVAWLRAELPPAPAQVLVGAAGAGAEVALLRSWGYQVDALDPAARAAEQCAAQLGGGVMVCAGYEALSAAVLDHAPSAAAPLAGRRYQAVLLGWGSLGHVLDARERERLLSACARLAPGGPVLASFLCGEDLTGRAAQWGAALGGGLARMLGRAPADPRKVALAPWFGFVHLFTEGEVEALARACGRTLRWGHEGGGAGYPHATFV